MAAFSLAAADAGNLKKVKLILGPRFLPSHEDASIFKQDIAVVLKQVRKINLGNFSHAFTLIDTLDEYKGQRNMNWNCSQSSALLHNENHQGMLPVSEHRSVFQTPVLSSKQMCLLIHVHMYDQLQCRWSQFPQPRAH
ncbi:hypothetical protein PsorP6_015400 [Peronosclerospora sorghi]|uniref:Uncharacterized protein n=1 Tax=Peronosclerospora sorghi TaxID=230839 RepID=A0ACC0WRI9_9STRA|nr:hypothetical protein PsorP6_015400 [Peronosclerospora sorghi]